MTESELSSYNEQDQGLGLKEAIREANRCLNCKKPQCKEGCPISNNIPEFIAALAKGNMGEARNIIAEKSNLPAVCGRVCPREIQCEGYCALQKSGKQIQIGKLERFVADFDFQMQLPSEKIPPKTRGKIAVIGSGPAGLTVAGDLAKAGFSVVVHEALPEPGGVLLYGIPAFRLPKEIVRREIRYIESLGVNFIVNSVAGVDFTADDLLHKGFDAVFIGSGTTTSKELDLPGKDLAGVIQSAYFLRMIALYQSHQIKREEIPVREGDSILVIGGGNVALDTARSAARLGAKRVLIVYRGERAKMRAHKSELEDAEADGIRFMFKATPVAYIGNDNRFSALRVNTPEGEIDLPADKVFLAVGARPPMRLSSLEGIDVDEKGFIKIKDRPYGMTSRKGLFAGGDVVHQPATVVLAMKEAKKVAEGIMAYVDAVKLLEL